MQKLSAFLLCLLVSKQVKADLNLDIPVHAPTPTPTLEISGKHLVLNGVGLHRRLFFKIYRVFLFLEAVSHDSDAILHSSGVKYARMVFLRDVSANQLRTAWRDDFEAQCEKHCDELRPYVESVSSQLPSMKEGEFIGFTFLPGELVIEKEGLEKIVVSNPVFAFFQLSIWLGNSPPSRSFKQNLLGLD